MYIFSGQLKTKYMAICETWYLIYKRKELCFGGGTTKYNWHLLIFEYLVDHKLLYVEKQSQSRFNWIKVWAVSTEILT